MTTLVSGDEEEKVADVGEGEQQSGEAGDEEETDAKHTPASSSSEIFCLFWTLTISSTSSISSRIEVFEFTASTLTNKSSSSANRPLITGDDVLISLSILRRVKMKTLGNVYLKQV